MSDAWLPRRTSHPAPAPDDPLAGRRDRLAGRLLGVCPSRTGWPNWSTEAGGRAGRALSSRTPCSTPRRRGGLRVGSRGPALPRHPGERCPLPLPAARREGGLRRHARAGAPGVPRLAGPPAQRPGPSSSTSAPAWPTAGTGCGSSRCSWTSDPSSAQRTSDWTWRRAPGSKPPDCSRRADGATPDPPWGRNATLISRSAWDLWMNQHVDVPGKSQVASDARR